RRILRRVAELVDVVRLELGPGGEERDRRAVVVIGPAGGGNDFGYVVHAHAVRQLRLALVERGRRIAQIVPLCPLHDVFVSRASDRRAVCILGDGQRDRGVVVGVVGAGRIVPAAPDHRVAARGQGQVGTNL